MSLFLNQLSNSSLHLYLYSLLNSQDPFIFYIILRDFSIDCLIKPSLPIYYRPKLSTLRISSTLDDIMLLMRLKSEWYPINHFDIISS